MSKEFDRQQATINQLAALTAGMSTLYADPESPQGRFGLTMMKTASGNIGAEAARMAYYRQKKLRGKSSSIGKILGTVGGLVAAPFTAGASIPIGMGLGSAVDSAVSGDYGGSAMDVGGAANAYLNYSNDAKMRRFAESLYMLRRQPTPPPAYRPPPAAFASPYVDQELRGATPTGDWSTTPVAPVGVSEPGMPGEWSAVRPYKSSPVLATPEKAMPVAGSASPTAAPAPSAPTQGAPWLLPVAAGMMAAGAGVRGAAMQAKDREKTISQAGMYPALANASREEVSGWNPWQRMQFVANMHQMGIPLTHQQAAAIPREERDVLERQGYTLPKTGFGAVLEDIARGFSFASNPEPQIYVYHAPNGVVYVR
jgi:hypothetical protein